VLGEEGGVGEEGVGDVIFVSGLGAGRREDKYRLVITTALVKDPKTKKRIHFKMMCSAVSCTCNYPISVFHGFSITKCCTKI
jgi:hypothetical protein